MTQQVRVLVVINVFCNIMDNFKFEGDLTGLSERQLKFVSSVLRDRGFNNDKVLVSTVGKADAGYASNIKRFTIEQNGVTFKMVAKVALSDETVRAQMNIKVIFHNEHIMYTEVLSKFTELEKQVGVSENERLRYATCYGFLSEEPNEIVLLEDLHASNFLLMNKHVSLTDDCVKLFIKNLASLHSLSHILKVLEPETYENYKRRLVNFWENMTSMEWVKSFFDQLKINVLAMCDDEINKTLVKRCLSNLNYNISENRKFDKVSQYSVIQHGDTWINNVLFRMEGTKAVQCCMIDYQVSNHNSPVADLQYMIFNCTDYETRAKHYHDWIDYYHSELDKCLANFGLKANFIYPRDQLDADLKRFSEFSFAISLMLANVMMNESKEAANVKVVLDNDNKIGKVAELSKLSNLDESTLARIKTRIDGLIKSYNEFGYNL